MQIEHGNGEGLYLTDTENISCGGVCFVLPYVLKLYTEVNLEINLRDDKPPIKSQGRVVWCLKNPPSPSFARGVFFVGVEFVELPEADKGRIKTIINVSEGEWKK